MTKSLSRSIAGLRHRSRRQLTNPLRLAVGIESLERRVCLATIGGVNLGNLTNYLFFFADGSKDANWQGASKGFAGDVVVNGITASERTSGGVPYAGTISTNDTTLGAWQAIVNQNAGQAFASTGQTALVNNLNTSLNSAFSQINALSATPGFTSVSATSLNGLNTQNGHADTIVINVTSGFQISSKINITGDANDAFILRWDTDANPSNGYQGQVKFQSGGAIVPLGGLTAANFVHVAGDLNASGGGGSPAAPYPQGPRLDNGTGNLITKGSDWGGGGFFTGYWLTTGDPATGETHPFSNAIFVGGWYTVTNKFSMTSGTSGVHVFPKQADLRITKTDNSATYTPGGTTTYTITVTNTGTIAANGATVTDNFPAQVTSDSWTASYSTGSSGPASGSGNINATINLAAGGTATFTVTAHISSTIGSTNQTQDFAGLGTFDQPLAQNITLNGVRADAFYLNSGSYVTSGTTLFLRHSIEAGSPASINDFGLGVLSPGENSALGHDKELGNATHDEIIRLTKPDSVIWTSLFVSSVESGVNGKLFWSNSPTPDLSTTPSFAFNSTMFGAAEEGNLLAQNIPNFNTNAKYVFFRAGPIPNPVNGNDFLVKSSTTRSFANLVNTATVIAPPGIIDPDLTNNSSTDTDTPSLANIILG